MRITAERWAQLCDPALPWEKRCPTPDELNQILDYVKASSAAKHNRQRVCFKCGKVIGRGEKWCFVEGKCRHRNCDVPDSYPEGFAWGQPGSVEYVEPGTTLCRRRGGECNWGLKCPQWRDGDIDSCPLPLSSI